MPLYEYECPECRKRFEKLFRPPARLDSPQTCPACGCAGAGRVLSAVGSVRAGRSEGRASSCGPAGSRFT